VVVVFVVVAAEVSTDTWLVLSCAGCGNRAREGEAIMWIVANEADDRTSTEAGLVVHCAPKKKKKEKHHQSEELGRKSRRVRTIATNRSLDANECKNLGIVRDWMT
jgi:hypothetical protein